MVFTDNFYKSHDTSNFVFRNSKNAYRFFSKYRIVSVTGDNSTIWLWSIYNTKQRRGSIHRTTIPRVYNKHNNCNYILHAPSPRGNQSRSSPVETWDVVHYSQFLEYWRVCSESHLGCRVVQRLMVDLFLGIESLQTRGFRVELTGQILVK